MLFRNLQGVNDHKCLTPDGETSLKSDKKLLNKLKEQYLPSKYSFFSSFKIATLQLIDKSPQKIRLKEINTHDNQLSLKEIY